MNQLHRLGGRRALQLPAQLAAGDSELAQQLTRDPYVLDFLDLTGRVRELDLEITLVQRVQALLLELGHGFAKSSGALLKSVGHESWYPTTRRAGAYRRLAGST